MAKQSLVDLLAAAATEVLHGNIPSTDILKPLISKVRRDRGLSPPAPQICASAFSPARASLTRLVPPYSAPQGLGYGILAGSTLVKVPQVANVLRAASAAGLAPLSFELETVGLLIAVSYGFLMGLPFSAFGETVVSGRGLALLLLQPPPPLLPLQLLVPHSLRTGAASARCQWSQRCRPPNPPALQALLLQNNLLLVLIYYYQRRSLARAATLLALLAGGGFVAVSGILTRSQVSALYDCNNLILVASK